MKFGITERFACGYLPEQQEQLLVLIDEGLPTSVSYSQLIQLGFRRSGEQIYRPHCPHCQACQSVRIPVSDFCASRSQKRILNKARFLSVRSSSQVRDFYYPMYQRYINHRHKDGAMYPPSYAQFEQFVSCSWKAPVFLEAWDGEKCVAVAVTDLVEDDPAHAGLSALYTFFEPAYEQYSLGTWMIMQQVFHARKLGLPFVYVGYYVADCQKMAYKRQFFPHEVFIRSKWCRFNKKTDC